MTHVKISILGIINNANYPSFYSIISVTKLDKSAFCARNSTIPSSTRFQVDCLMKYYEILMSY